MSTQNLPFYIAQHCCFEEKERLLKENEEKEKRLREEKMRQEEEEKKRKEREELEEKAGIEKEKKEQEVNFLFIVHTKFIVLHSTKILF